MVQFRASHMPMNFGDMEKALGFTVGFDSMFERVFGALDQTNPSRQGYPLTISEKTEILSISSKWQLLVFRRMILKFK